VRIKRKLRLSALGAFDRVLLSSDGTLTHVLEAHALESITLVALTQTLSRAHRSVPLLRLRKSETLLNREVLLRGSRTGKHYLYASSQIAADRLCPEFLELLLAAKLPIGLLWKKLRIETYKEILHMGRRAAGKLAVHFGVDANHSLLFRKYRVFSSGRPSMIITEAFPEPAAASFRA
jgi:chorismate-pyruvate lyase